MGAFLKEYLVIKPFLEGKAPMQVGVAGYGG
jgi:hypothetical protein